MKREITDSGTWVYTIRVYGRLLVSEDVDREAAFDGLMALLARRIHLGAGGWRPGHGDSATADDGAVTDCG